MPDFKKKRNVRPIYNRKLSGHSWKRNACSRKHIHLNSSLQSLFTIESLGIYSVRNLISTNTDLKWRDHFLNLFKIQQFVNAFGDFFTFKSVLAPNLLEKKLYNRLSYVVVKELKRTVTFVSQAKPTSGQYQSILDSIRTHTNIVVHASWLNFGNRFAAACTHRSALFVETSLQKTKFRSIVKLSHFHDNCYCYWAMKFSHSQQNH